jgi:transposase
MPSADVFLDVSIAVEYHPAIAQYFCAKLQTRRILPLPTHLGTALRRYLRQRPATEAKELFVGHALLGGTMVCIDLSETYRSLVKRWFPRARIVADCFHAVRVVGLHLMRVARQLCPDLGWNRAWLGLLRRRAHRLDSEQRHHLQRLGKIVGQREGQAEENFARHRRGESGCAL